MWHLKVAPLGRVQPAATERIMKRLGLGLCCGCIKVVRLLTHNPKNKGSDPTALAWGKLRNREDGKELVLGLYCGCIKVVRLLTHYPKNKGSNPAALAR